jgi:hypothetical protein
MKRFVIYAAVSVFILLALTILLPSSSHPEATRRVECCNNVQRIVLALQDYHLEFGAFPPAYIADEHGRPKHSWRVLILPYLDAQKVYNQYRFDEPWSSPHNLSLQDDIPKVYQCPSFLLAHQRQATHSQHFQRLANYVAISDPSGIFDTSNSNRISDVTDGTSTTVLVAEVRNHAVHWLEPSDASVNDVISDLLVSSDASQANHAGGLLFGMADGGVTFIPADTDVDKVRGLITKSGGEPRQRF